MVKKKFQNLKSHDYFVILESWSLVDIIPCLAAIILCIIYVYLCISIVLYQYFFCCYNYFCWRIEILSLAHQNICQRKETYP
jgi:hypothetical protein